MYLDAHGEEDRNLRRGRALFLSHSRYEQLARLMAGHAHVADTLLLREVRISDENMDGDV